MSQRIGVLEESFNEDITRVRFHPFQSNLITTSSTDGLVCEFDMLHIDNENDALSKVFNTKASVSTFGIFSPVVNSSFMYTISHIETLSLWKYSEESTCLAEYRDIVDFASEGMGCRYLIDAHFDSAMQRLSLFGGMDDGTLLEYFVTTDYRLMPLRSVPNLHSDVIRTVYVDDTRGVMFTGGEDGQVSVLSVRDSTPNTSTTSTTTVLESSPYSSKKKKRFSPY